MKTLEIGDRLVGSNEPTFVIAEAGSNHNGDLDRAKQLIEAAAAAGTDAVKFQTFRAEDLYVEDSGGVEYLDDDRSIYEIIESMEMPYEWIPILRDCCLDHGVQFMSTPFDERSADELEPYVPAFKIASYTITHHPFLRTLAASDRPIIMSTGSHEFDEVEASVSVLRDAGCDDLALLQCVAAYPTPLESINVQVVQRLRDAFDVPTGLSDHTLDPVTAPTAAVALGAAIVEKHFTLDRSLDGPDHSFAVEPAELERMVAGIRDTERVLGDGKKRVLDIESELYDVARRAIHTTEPISEGSVFTSDNVSVLRPGTNESGLHPKFYEEVLGQQAAHAIDTGAGITWEDVASRSLDE